LDTFSQAAPPRKRYTISIVEIAIAARQLTRGTKGKTLRDLLG